MKNFLALTLALSTLILAACERDTTYDRFAQCIADSGAVYYGSFLCHNCQEQTELFGDAKDLLPYVECTEGGKNAQPALCRQEKITATPTWKFPDGRVEIGKKTLAELSELSSCPLPGEESVMVE